MQFKSELMTKIYNQVKVYGPLTIPEIAEHMDFKNRGAIQTILEYLVERNLVVLKKDLSNNYHTTYLWQVK